MLSYLGFCRVTIGRFCLQIVFVAASDETPRFLLGDDRSFLLSGAVAPVPQAGSAPSVRCLIPLGGVLHPPLSAPARVALALSLSGSACRCLGPPLLPSLFDKESMSEEATNVNH